MLSQGNLWVMIGIVRATQGDASLSVIWVGGTSAAEGWSESEHPSQERKTVASRLDKLAHHRVWPARTTGPS